MNSFSVYIYKKSCICWIAVEFNLLSVHVKKNASSMFIGFFFSPSRWLFHPFSYKHMLTWLRQFLYLSCITRELEISILSILKLKWAETEDNRFLLSKTVSFHNKERKKTHNRGPSWINEEKSIWTKTPVKQYLKNLNV